MIAGAGVMLIAGLAVFLLILGMFLQALTSSPRNESEWHSDTDDVIPSTPARVNDDTHPAVA